MSVDFLNRCHFGDVREVLRSLIDAGVRVQTIVTSPPYWGLRDYGHAGQIGLEPTIGEFIATMTDVFSLVREVLADDGTAWVNMGDCYATGAGKVGEHPGGGDQGEGWTGGRGSNPSSSKSKYTNQAQGMGPMTQPNRLPQPGLKPKDLVGQPWRLAFALQDAGWYLRQDIIWNKPNPMPESVRDRCTKAHEYVFLLSKSERYYFDFEAFQEPVSGGANPRRPGNKTHKHTNEFERTGDERHRTKSGLVAYAERQRAGYKTPDGWDTSKGEGGHGSFHKAGREKGHVIDQGVGHRQGPPGNEAPRKLAHKDAGREDQGLRHSEKFGRGAGWRVKNNDSMDEALAVMPTMRNRRSVWTVGSEPYKGAHFATYPTKLIEPCILAGCPPGGIVLDPFFGSGTTGQVAQDLGRNWIGIELNPAYKALQDERLRQPALKLEPA